MCQWWGLWSKSGPKSAFVAASTTCVGSLVDEVFGEMKWLAEVEQLASGWNILNHGACWGWSYSLPEVLMGTFVRGWKERLYTRKQTWNLKMMVPKRKLLFQTFIFSFSVSFRGCTWDETYKLFLDPSKCRTLQGGIATFYSNLGRIWWLWWFGTEGGRPSSPQVLWNRPDERSTTSRAWG